MTNQDPAAPGASLDVLARARGYVAEDGEFVPDPAGAYVEWHAIEFWASHKTEPQLDAAWADAERVLPVGRMLFLNRWLSGKYAAGVRVPNVGGHPTDMSVVGATPQAALRALAARLHELVPNPTAHPIEVREDEE